MTSTVRMTGEARREQILDAARELFAARGYATTTSDVAERVGVSPALVVKYFGTKDELFRAAVAQPIVELFERTLAGVRARTEGVAKGDLEHDLARLVEFGRDWIALVTEHRQLLLSLLRESVEFSDVTSQVLRLLTGLVDEVAQGLGHLSETGDYVDFDPRLITYAGLGALTFGALFTDDPDAMAVEYHRHLLFGLLSEDARARVR